MVEFGNQYDLRKKIKQTQEMLKCEKDPNIRVALYDYIQELYYALYFVSGNTEYLDKRKIFGRVSNYRQFMKKVDQHLKKWMENFVFYKGFHQDYFNKVLITSETEFIEKLNDNRAGCDSNKGKLSEKEFFEVFHDFCSSLGLEKEYNEIVSDKKIFSTTKGKEDGDFLGLTTHNPLNGDSNIFIDEFQYDFESLFTLVHEFGHYYDFKEFTARDNTSDYFHYSWKSLYLEVVSRMFERLFLNFLIKNGILLDEAIDGLMNMEFENHNFMLSAYALSLLDDNLLLSGEYEYLSAEDLYQKLSSYFTRDYDSFCEFMGSTQDSMSDVVYSYGDILSMFLKEAVEAEGLNSPLMKKFQKERIKEFDDHFILEEGFDSAKYKDLFKKELQLIKKR